MVLHSHTPSVSRANRAGQWDASLCIPRRYIKHWIIRTRCVYSVLFSVLYATWCRQAALGIIDHSLLLGCYEIPKENICTSCRPVPTLRMQPQPGFIRFPVLRCAGIKTPCCTLIRVILPVCTVSRLLSEDQRNIGPRGCIVRVDVWHMCLSISSI